MTNETNRYEELEKDFLGDSKKETGIYHPEVIEKSLNTAEGQIIITAH